MDPWKRKMEIRTYGKGQTEGDQLSAHEMEVESLRLHLGFVPERAGRGRRCSSPACAIRTILPNTFTLAFLEKKIINQTLDEKANQKLQFESHLFFCLGNRERNRRSWKERYLRHIQRCLSLAAACDCLSNINVCASKTDPTTRCTTEGQIIP